MVRGVAYSKLFEGARKFVARDGNGETNARVLHTTVLRPLRAGVPLIVTSLLATVAAFVVPQTLGEPVSPVWLLMLRVAIVAAVCLPVMLAAAVPVELFRRVPVQR